VGAAAAQLRQLLTLPQEQLLLLLLLLLLHLLLLLLPLLLLHLQQQQLVHRLHLPLAVVQSTRSTATTMAGLGRRRVCRWAV
jgi:hypothetical protein